VAILYDDDFDNRVDRTDAIKTPPKPQAPSEDVDTEGTSREAPVEEGTEAPAEGGAEEE
jgi:hypothetical protein